MKLCEWADYKPQMIGERESFHAAVLIPLIRRDEKTDPENIQILFEVRSSKVQSQPGDICFPGGAREGEENAEENAVRETCEELQVTPDQIRVLGQSDRLFTHNMLVAPVVGYLDGYEGGRNPEEVEETFAVPLSFFLENEPEHYVVNYRMEFPEDFPFDRIYGGRDYGWHPRKDELLFWQYQDRVIWGMTAKILYSFVKLWRSES